MIAVVRRMGDSGGECVHSMPSVFGCRRRYRESLRQFRRFFTAGDANEEQVARIANLPGVQTNLLVPAIQGRPWQEHLTAKVKAHSDQNAKDPFRGKSHGVRFAGLTYIQPSKQG